MRAPDYPIVSVRNLSKHYPLRSWWGGKASVFRAVEDVSFDIRAGETLGLVGESGSGKSTIGRAVTMLNPPTAGTVAFEGTDLAKLSPRAMRGMRARIQTVFQDPYAALNPRMSVGDYVSEAFKLHRPEMGRAERRAAVAGLFERVGLEPRFAGRFPHQFSGGQRQRICIARAIALKPSFIVADEPIAALDVSIQAQVVNLLQDLQAELGLSYLFISHDLRMVRYLCHRVAVLWRGRIVELAESDALYDDPRHPYTRRLLGAVPVPDPAAERARLAAEQARPASPIAEGGDLVEVAPGHWVATRS
ncbi:ATP-binding cassette domain-containing protein [Methylobacterium sp. E-041]|jgi:peptide/nickel transport system ATP-binding protein|nr:MULTISPECIES: ATP-binding cassette domain-containing protein [unclassified Methylobacterium]MCJ2007247.1 ATP-binding cassette domain-containing protein [Methylobacterium sp. J-092]MCJ2039790.1 ATP-binding cassette domain-containing protein [Methylobacterium sp. J-059]MCJ2079583.1 ATP-binding cassette domain-containing protein [Methylobacterium sp. E-016]MCJ2108152.1 ATP-binding cassette domain-containing protein [Methylobacterium sp. E-041]MCJ2112878.1 ATP-binding cassette domain-containing